MAKKYKQKITKGEGWENVEDIGEEEKLKLIKVENKAKIKERKK